MNVSMFMFLLFGLGLVAHATLSNVVSEDMSHEMNLLSVDLTPQFKIRLVEPESLVSGAASNFTVEAKASGRLIHKEGYAVTLTLAPRSNGTCIMDMSNMVGAVQKDGIATITDVKVTLSSSAADAVCTFELQLTQISAPDTILTNTFSDIPIHNNSPPQPTPSNVFDLQIKSPNEMESGIEATIHASVTEDGHPITVEKRYTVHLSIADNSKASPACSMASSILTADVDSKGDLTFPNVVLNILQNVSDVLCPLRFTLNDLNNQSDPRVAVIERSMRLIKSSVPPHTYELKIESPSEFHSGVASDMQLAVLMDGSPFPATSTSTHRLSMQVGGADTVKCSLDGAPIQFQQISSGQVTFHAVTLTLLTDEPTTEPHTCTLYFNMYGDSSSTTLAQFVKIVNVVPAQQPAPVQYQMRIEKPYKFVSGTAVTVVVQVLIKNAPAHAADGLQVSMSFPQNGLCKFSTSNEITNAVQDDGVANLGPVVVLSNATTESVTHCDVQLSLSQTSAPTVVIEHTTVSVPFDQAQAPVYSTSISFNSDIRFNATTKISVVVRVANQVPPPESALSLKMSVEPSTAQCTLKNDPLVVSVDPKNGTGTFTDVVFEKVSSKNSAERCAPESVGCSEGETTSCTVTITILNHAAPVRTVPFTIDINPSSDPVNPSPLPPPGPDKKTRHVSYMFMIILVAVVLGGLVGIAVYLFRKRRASASMVSLNDDASYRKVRFGS